MNAFCGGLGKLLQPAFGSSVRHASKKAGSATRNSKSSRGQHRQIFYGDNRKIPIYDMIATQRRLNWMPGMNVGVGGRTTLIALKAGTVIFTCETPDLDMTQHYSQKFFSGREGTVFYKKYAHVIPTPQHTRFKLVSQT